MIVILGCAADLLEPPWPGRVDGESTEGQFLDLNTNQTDRIYLRYGVARDSGVEVERSTSNHVVWRVHVKPLGVEHSKYNHHVFARIRGGNLHVYSSGNQVIREIRSLGTGALISREIDPKTYY
jgi:hypothetical protein